jgi:hypothetical protein
VAAPVLEKFLRQLPTGIGSVLKRHGGRPLQGPTLSAPTGILLISIKPAAASIGHGAFHVDQQNQALDKDADNNSATALARKVSFLSRPESYKPTADNVVAKQAQSRKLIRISIFAYLLISAN